MTHDNVNHPSHYTEGRAFEVIEVLEDWCGRAPDPVLGALQWSCLKYQGRLWDKVDPLEDAKKSRWYLDRLISKLEAEKVSKEYDDTGLVPWDEWINDGWHAAEPVPFDGSYDLLSFEMADSGADTIVFPNAAEAGATFNQEFEDMWDTDDDFMLDRGNGSGGEMGGVNFFLKSKSDRITDAGDYDWDQFYYGKDISDPQENCWVSLTNTEINLELARKDLTKFQEDEIVSTVEKRGMIIGVRKDGSTCVLNSNGNCE
jgi:hypothetical protein